MLPELPPPEDVDDGVEELQANDVRAARIAMRMHSA
jgi:hypothetical protein